MFDLIIRNGTVIDGTRAPSRKADICISGGRIAKIAEHVTDAAHNVIDAEGLIVSPGFVDIHSHSDAMPLVSYRPESKLYQGVTFELCGNCGLSVLPATAESRKELNRYLEGELNCPIGELEYTLLDMNDYAEQGNANGMETNYGMLVGHSALRCSVMGFDNRTPTADEQAQLEARLDSELGQGAFGMSLGLIYPPSAFSETEELEGLARIVKKHNGILSVHMRNEGPRVFEAVDEMLAIALHTGVHLEISHLKIMTKSLWGKGAELLKRIDDAVAQGATVTCDQYPYVASSTSMTAMVPKWAHAGGVGAMLERLAAPTQELKDDIAKEMESRGGADRVMVSSVKNRSEFDGHYLSDIAEKLSLTPVDAILYLLCESGCVVSCIYFSQFEEDVELILSRVDIAVGSDGYNHSLDPKIMTYPAHLRNYGTFPNALAMMRDQKLLPIEDAVYKMTGLPASILGMTEHGVLAENTYADITIFNAETVGHTNDFSNPTMRPTGIEYVIVAGQIILSDGVITDGVQPGKILRRGGC